MATRAPITLNEGNDEILQLTITPVDPAESLAAISALRVYLKPDDCAADTDLGVLVLTTADPNQVLITAQTADQIEATAYIPHTALQGSYSRVWRVDAYRGDTHRTAMFGPVAVNNL